LGRGGAQPQYGWLLLALHEHIVSRVSVSATNSTASGASAGSAPASGAPVAPGGPPPSVDE
jgi:hypothetical protein